MNEDADEDQDPEAEPLLDQEPEPFPELESDPALDAEEIEALTWGRDQEQDQDLDELLTRPDLDPEEIEALTSTLDLGDFFDDAEPGDEGEGEPCDAGDADQEGR